VGCEGCGAGLVSVGVWPAFAICAHVAFGSGVRPDGRRVVGCWCPGRRRARAPGPRASARRQTPHHVGHQQRVGDPGPARPATTDNHHVGTRRHPNDRADQPDAPTVPRQRQRLPSLTTSRVRRHEPSVGRRPAERQPGHAATTPFRPTARDPPGTPDRRLPPPPFPTPPRPRARPVPRPRRASPCGDRRGRRCCRRAARRCR